MAALSDILKQIGAESTRRDTVVFLGDYIDRGPDSRGCVEAILRFQDQTEEKVVCLIGNHEDWFLRTLHDHNRHSWLLGMEAFDTIRSYSVEADVTVREAVANAGSELYAWRCALPYSVFIDSMPKDHIGFFEGLQLYCRTADCLCVHGGLDPSIALLQDQPRNALIWGAGDSPEGYKGEEVVVYGHRDDAVVNAAGWSIPRADGRTIGIDTISHGVLTAIRVPDRRLFQSARFG